MRPRSLPSMTLSENTAGRILGCRADMWLDERLFRLPGLNQAPLYHSQPPSGPMMNAFYSGQTAPMKGQRKHSGCPAQERRYGDGRVTGGNDPTTPFNKKEIELLDGLAGHISLALVASHRFLVEQWRIEQLTLVRRVSAEIANVFDMNELTRRVAKLIQSTFQYYYVAIFTSWTGPGRGLPLPAQCWS